MGPVGVPEMIIILVIALIVFGPRKLPELGRSLGKSLGEFKRASNDLRNTLDEEIRIEEKPDEKSSFNEKSKSIQNSNKPAVATDPASGVHPTEPDVGT
ncbi:MAG TPA: TatA/E family twin arginine-targeting protein translocase [Acidobacteria bacterium]|jgi:TatA/E family protein of Tat protein translocase|nr:TatA/E family twin arginine-targeting protein translocase [Acidobacteriota bacterium]